MKYIKSVAFLFVVSVFNTNLWAEQYTGVRMSDTGDTVSVFSSKTAMAEYATNISSQIKGSTPAILLVLGGVQDNNICHLPFPSEYKVRNVSFEKTDRFEPYLSHFDQAGVKVFLQVESGDANVERLIKIILKRYKHHPSVVGFGLDVEWYKNKPNTKYAEGKRVSNKKAKLWEKTVKSVNPNYRLFLKHWEAPKMPSKYRGDLIFVDDSQQFASLNDLVAEFTQWIDAFPNNTVFFQYGYRADKKWWNKLKNPPIDIAQALLKVDDSAGMFWVDFTLKDLDEWYFFGFRKSNKKS